MSTYFRNNIPVKIKPDQDSNKIEYVNINYDVSSDNAISKNTVVDKFSEIDDEIDKLKQMVNYLEYCNRNKDNNKPKKIKKVLHITFGSN